MESEYEGQARGSRGDYARYLAAMDASMRQKVALTAAHLLCEGRIADMGTGSGGASYALAQLYPHLEVVGVDVSETMVRLARERHQLTNLSFVVGDAAAPVFERGSLDGILASSMLHHVTSFNGYDPDAARRALEAQALSTKVSSTSASTTTTCPRPSAFVATPTYSSRRLGGCPSRRVP